MPKRSRLTARPGQRRPLQRPPARPDAAERPFGGVTRAEELRAAELEAAILAEEKTAEESRRTRERARRPAVDAVGEVSYTSVPLAVRAGEEYGYVKRDIRRITIVGGFLIGILAILEILVNGAHLFTL
ncbi:MAG: hypothetical protein NVS9B8_07350 [Candidatus Limnocylindrales bacterium]